MSTIRTVENVQPVSRRSVPRANASSRRVSQTTAPSDNALLPIAGWLIVVISAVFAVLKVAPGVHGDDWSSLYIGGMLAGQGNWTEAYSVHPDDFSRTGSMVWEQFRKEHTTVNFAHPFVHNPGVALFMAGLSSLLTFTQSIQLLTFVSGACAVMIPAAAYKFWTSKTIPVLYLIPLTVFVWITEPFNMSLQLGQTTPLILTACMIALAVSKDKPLVAAVLLSLATFVKLTPVVLIAGLALIPTTRKAGMYAAGLTFAWFAPLIALFHEPFTIWISSLKRHGTAFLVSPINASIGSVIYAPLRENEGVAIVDNVPSFPVTLAMGIVVAVAGGVFLNRWRKGREFPVESFLALCLLGPMCVAGILWIHYSVALVFPLVGLFIWGFGRKDWILVAVSVVGSVVLVVPFDFGYVAAWNPVTLAHLGLWIIVVVAVASLGCAERDNFGRF